MRFAAAPLLVLGLLAACAAPPPRGPEPNLPAALQAGLTDPGRSAVDIVSAVFPNPASVRGRPVLAANAVSNYEWLTASLPTDQRWIQMPATVASQMRLGRDALRAAFGIPTDAQTNDVIAAFDGAAAAFGRNDAAGAATALGAVTGPANAPRAVALLSNLPAIPAAAQGASAAQQGMAQMDQLSQPRGR